MLARPAGLLLIGLALFAATAVGGCSAMPPGSSESKKSAEAPAKAPSKPSASEQAYSEYLKTLSSEQVALRESLNPDALAGMSDSEMTDAFTIKADEVTVDGKIDPNLYAEAFAARYQAIGNSGLSEVEYAKWGGPDSFGTDDIKVVAQNYMDIQGPALFGYVGDSEMNRITLSRGSGYAEVTGEPYHLRVTVRPKSISKFLRHDNGSYDIRFSGYMSDNWDKAAMERSTGLSIEPTDGFITWGINGLRITESGAVLPSEAITFN